MSSPDVERIFLPRLTKSWQADAFIGTKVSTAMGAIIIIIIIIIIINMGYYYYSYWSRHI